MTRNEEQSPTFEEFFKLGGEVVVNTAENTLDIRYKTKTMPIPLSYFDQASVAEVKKRFHQNTFVQETVEDIETHDSKWKLSKIVSQDPLSDEGVRNAAAVLVGVFDKGAGTAMNNYINDKGVPPKEVVEELSDEDQLKVQQFIENMSAYGDIKANEEEQ